jgi:hypothetical protein
MAAGSIVFERHEGDEPAISIAARRHHHRKTIRAPTPAICRKSGKLECFLSMFKFAI